MSLLEVQNLKVHFPLRRGVLRRTRETVRAVDGVSFSVAAGETVGLVGESGCGKSTLCRALVRLEEPTEGRIIVDGEDWASLRGGALRARRQKLQMIFQDPFASLNPRLTVEQILREPLDIHGLARGRAARTERIARLLRDVGIDPAQAGRYPHEFSGGQRQRIGIARALAVEPRLIVCDEPVSALDVSIQAQIINLLRDLQREHGLGYLFVAHDLAVVEHISQRILVMYLGRIVEAGEARLVCATPQHPYTRALLSAVPNVQPDTGRRRIILRGDVASPVNPPGGCPFHPRCPVAEARCRSDAPTLRSIGDGRSVACHLTATSNTDRTLQS